jgi:hypothetical protein
LGGVTTGTVSEGVKTGTVLGGVKTGTVLGGVSGEGSGEAEGSGIVVVVSPELEIAAPWENIAVDPPQLIRRKAGQLQNNNFKICLFTIRIGRANCIPFFQA